MRGANRQVTRLSRRLRVNQTEAEKKLWGRLRNRQIAGCKFVRQERVGPYICDFVCRERKLVVEADGGQHLDSVKDEARDRYLAIEGYRVLRFGNNDILGNIDGVVIMIEAALK